MARTLLPIFNKFKLTQALDLKEEPETFQWMKPSIRSDLEQAKAALDSLPGSREYLKNYAHDKETMPFSDPIGVSLLWKFGDHHSGASASILAWTYKKLLNDWDTFVYVNKEAYAKTLYKSRQLTEDDISAFITQEASSSYKLPRTIERIKEDYNLTASTDEVHLMLKDLADELQSHRVLKKLRAEQERLHSRLDVLRHHYLNPTRWLDGAYGSSLFGSPEDITHEMIEHMTRVYPDYPYHLKKVIAAHKAQVAYLASRKDLMPSEVAGLYSLAQDTFQAMLEKN
jgi:hypothetical protein